jgi:uncharacterized membrane protein
MLAFTLALRPIHQLFRRTSVNLWLFGAVLFPMLSIGVYLGLVLRYNSWDLINRPMEVLGAITVIIDKPMLTSFIVVFAGFLWLAYTVIDTWIDGIIARWRTTVKPLDTE